MRQACRIGAIVGIGVRGSAVAINACRTTVQISGGWAWCWCVGGGWVCPGASADGARCRDPVARQKAARRNTETYTLLIVRAHHHSPRT